MRARNLKPSLFKNELLATSDPLFAWVFEGLWCLADREGRLEDRPRKIHLEINAGRAYEGTESALNWLSENGFIVRYEHGQCRYIQVVQFGKHQNPHVREPASTIPAPGEHGAGTVLGMNGHHSGPALSSFPLPDSPSLNPSPTGEDAREPRCRDRVKLEVTPIPESAPAGLDGESWTRWLEYRRQIKRPLKQASIPAAQRKLAALGDDQVAVVEQSIANGWTGLFPLGRAERQRGKARGFCA